MYIQHDDASLVLVFILKKLGAEDLTCLMRSNYVSSLLKVALINQYYNERTNLHNMRLEVSVGGLHSF
jgi:hypothetical protein